MFQSIATEGAILPADLLRRVADGDVSLGGLSASTFHLAGGEKLGEAISRSWSRLLGAWTAFRNAREQLPATDLGTSLTRDRWLMPLFHELGYGRLGAAKGLQAGGVGYAISHLWQNVPIHLVSFRTDLDTRSSGVAGAARRSPHGLLQEFLNKSNSHLWGFVSNGSTLRLLRDNASLSRQAHVEFDLEAMFEGELYSDFSLLWLVCHESRLEADEPRDCWLEKWSQYARIQGTRALDQLRGGVEEAIARLGGGFLAHPSNRELREALQQGMLSGEEFYRQLLRLVYRLLFLFVAEDRGLLHRPKPGAAAVTTYKLYYSTDRLRRLAARHRGTGHHDLYTGLRIVMSALGADEGCDRLALPALGSFLFSDEATASVNSCLLANRDLLAAIRSLAFTVSEGVLRVVDYRNLGAEELGSVYESLLDLHPEINVPLARVELQHGGKERRATGAHYTPTSILRQVLDFALEPAIEDALRKRDPESALLALRVLDPACGSGHFLIAAAQRIGKRLAVVRTGDDEPPPESVRKSVRDVVSRCVYGVDLNPMAVELCKVALWMETLEPGKPLGFLDHHIQCGDSLIGAPLDTSVERARRLIEKRHSELQDELKTIDSKLLGVEDRRVGAQMATRRRELQRELRGLTYVSWPDHLPEAAFRATGDDEKAIAKSAAEANRVARMKQQRRLFALPRSTRPLAVEFGDIEREAEDTIQAVRAKSRRFRAAQSSTEYERTRLKADLWCAAFFWPLKKSSPPPPTEEALWTAADDGAWDSPTLEQVRCLAEKHRFFHFELMCPEVLATEVPGFDVVIGNPPYLGGKKISSSFGDHYLKFLKTNNPEASGTTDLSAYFFRRAFDLLRTGGNLGFVATNTIAQGDTRAAALLPISRDWGGSIANAVRSTTWEGVANLEVAIVHLHKGPWNRRRTLDGHEVETISSMLDDGVAGLVEPTRLRANGGIAFQGATALGMGFIVTPEHASALIANNPANRDVLFPYLNGEDLSGRPDQSASRWIINFFDWPLDRESAPASYRGKVAADYPDCLEILRTRVLPERAGASKEVREAPWWQLWRLRGELLRATAGLERAYAVPRHTKYLTWAAVPAGQVFSDATVCVASESASLFAILQSAVHATWLNRAGASTLETRLRYTPSDFFETFAFAHPTPEQEARLAVLGERLGDQRRVICETRRIGLTKLYNLVHDPATASDTMAVQKQEPPFDDIRAIRQTHEELDRAAFSSYGWSDLEPVYDFYRGKDAGPNVSEDDVRFTLHSALRSTVLRRLLGLNEERAVEEAATLSAQEQVESALAWFDGSRVVAGTPGLDAVAAEAWATPDGVTAENVALVVLLEVLRAFGTAVADRVRLAAALALRPALATALLDKTNQPKWLRAVGKEASPLPQNVVSIHASKPAWAHGMWGDAVAFARAAGLLTETAGMWTFVKSGVDTRQPWAEGRASVVVKLVEHVDVIQTQANLLRFVKDVEDGKAGAAVSAG